MNLAPRSLFARNVLLLLALILLSLAGAGTFLRYWLQKPRIEQLAELVVRHVRAVQSELEALPVEQRNSAVGRLGAGGDPRVVAAGAVRPPPQAIRGDLLSLRFLEQIVRLVPGGAANVRWSADSSGTLWVLLPVAGEPYWFIVSGVQPEGGYSAVGLGLTALTAVLSVTGAALLQRRIHRPLARLGEAANPPAQGAGAPPGRGEAPT